MVESKPDYVITTRPILPPISKQPTITTLDRRITLRPFREDDLPALHELRSQIEVMKWTSTGSVDADLDKTRTWMDRYMRIENETQSAIEHNEKADSQPEAQIPATSFNFVIVYKEDTVQDAAQTLTPGTVIGAGGCHVFSPEPECGYMIRKEFWGRGIATSVLQAFLTEYWKLERETVQIPWNQQLHRSADVSQDGCEATVREVLSAVIVADNIGSQRVLEKCGFEHCFSETICEHGKEVILVHYILTRP